MKKRISLLRIAEGIRKTRPEEFKAVSQTLQYLSTVEDGIPIAPLRDHGAPALLTAQPQEPAPAASLAPTEPLPADFQQESLEENEVSDEGLANDDLEKEDGGDGKEELAPLYSSDEDDEPRNLHATKFDSVPSIMPGLIVAPSLLPPTEELQCPPPSPPPPPMQQEQQEQEVLVLAATKVLPEEEEQQPIVSPAKDVSKVAGSKQRTSPQHVGGGGGKASKPPLKLIKAEEYVAKQQLSPKRMPHTSPAKPEIILNDNNNAINTAEMAPPAVSNCFGYHLAAEPSFSLDPPPKKRSCLEDAVTAAQMVAHLFSEEDRKPNQYALRPLPPPQPYRRPPSAAKGEVDSEDLPSLNVDIEFPSLGRPSSGAKAADQVVNISQMGDSEPQEEHGRVRFVRDLILGKNPAYNRERTVPAQSAPLIAPPPPVFAAPQVPPPPPAAALAAPAVGPASQHMRATPAEAIQTALAPAVAATAAPHSRTAVRSTEIPQAAAAGPRAPTPLSVARLSSRPGATAAPVDLSYYLGGELFNAMLKCGGVPPRIYQWQADCLMTDGGRVCQKNGRNLVYSAPTSAGKTLVAEILLLRALANDMGRKTMLVLPYQALCAEKAQRLAPLLKPLQKEVREYHGGRYSRIDEHNVGIIVCTIENANSILNRHLEEGATPIQDEFSCIVCDELHLLSDPGRGYLLELLLTKLRYHEKCTELKREEAEKAKENGPDSVAKKQAGEQQEEDPATGGGSGAITISPDGTNRRSRTFTTTTGTSVGAATRRIQIIGMSATLPNIKQLGDWLDAAVYVSDHRPVPLTEYFKCGRDMLTVPPAAAEVGAAAAEGGAPAATAAAAAVAPLVSRRQLPPATKADPNHVAYLTRETIDAGHSVLIFCASKSGCVEEAARLAGMVEIPVREKPNVAGQIQPVPPRSPSKSTKTNAAPGGGGNEAAGVESEDEEEEEEDAEYMEYLKSFEYTREAVAAALEALPIPQIFHANLVRKGIAYHNSNLSRDEKMYIEGAYRSGAVSVLCATSTLSAGVNLPARRVIFLNPYKAFDHPGNYLTVTQYQQMAGRAGRAGIDDCGESILIHDGRSKMPFSYYEHLLRASLERIESCLTTNPAHMLHAILDPICNGTVSTPTDVVRYISSFLAATDADQSTVKRITDMVKAALTSLGEHQGPQSDQKRVLLLWNGKKYTPTMFGKAAMYSGLSPELAMKVMKALIKARLNFVMDSELYSCYVCIPVYSEFRMNRAHWRHLEQIIKEIKSMKKSGTSKKGKKRVYDSQDDVEDPADYRAAESIGILGDQYAFYIKDKANSRFEGSKAPTLDAYIRIENTCRNFYIACMLQQLISEERTKEDVAREFQVYSASFMENVQQSTAMFAKKCRVFCTNVRWQDMAAVLEEFGSRIRHGANREILALSKIPNVKPPTARLLFQAGLMNVEDVAKADQKTIMKALAKGNCYANLSKEEAKNRIKNKALKIWDAAKALVRDGVDLLDDTSMVAVPEIRIIGGSGHGFGGHALTGPALQQILLRAQRALPRAAVEKAAEKAPERKEKRQKIAEVAEERKEPEEIRLDGHTEDWEAMRSVPPPALFVPAVAPAQPPPAAVVTQTVPAAAVSDGNAISTVQKEATLSSSRPPLPPPAPAPAKNNNIAAAGGGGISAGGSRVPRRHKKVERTVFLLNSNTRVDNFIRTMLHDRPIFGAQFITVPHQKAYINDPLAHLKSIAAMAPPAKIKKKQGQTDKKKVTLYDSDLDGGDVKAQKSSGPKPGTVLGLAISWAPGLAAYIPLYGPAFNGDVTLAAQQLADAILASDVEIAWFGWKKQVEATRWLFSHASTSNATRTGANLHRFMTDARIAVWLSNSDAGYFQDGIFTEGDLNSNLLTSDGKRKRVEEQRVLGAEMVLTTFHRGDPTVPNAVLGSLRKDDEESPVGYQALRACQTAAVALQLHNDAITSLEKYQDPALLDALRRYEMPLVPVLADMERAGTGFSIEKLNKMLPRMLCRLDELEKLAHEAAGVKFELTSPAQVSNALYRNLQLPPPYGCEKVKVSKRDGSTFTSYSTAAKFLEMIKDAHPIVPMIMEHRKLVNTVERVTEMHRLAKAEKELLISESSLDEDVVKKIRVVAVHCPIMQLGTATGRLAMEGFNLQNLTKPYPFKAMPTQPQDGDGGGVLGGAAAGPVRVGSEDVEFTQGGGHMQLEANMRAAIVPSKPGRTILAADFRQIEFRMMAHFSKDPVVKEMLADGAEDPFKLVASRWKRLPVDKVTPNIRDHAKQIIYALFYGMGANAMADKLGVSPKTAKKMKEEFLDTYSGIKNWIEQVKVDTADCGYIKTLSGRRRLISEIQSKDADAKASGERKAVNSICQGSAADVAKKAMIDICREFEEQNLRGRVDMVLQIHDELVFEVDVEYRDTVARIVKRCMENAAVLEIPLRAKLETGESWGTMQRLEI